MARSCRSTSWPATPVDIYVNGRLIARGEVLVLNDNFAVRVAELVAANNTPAT